MLPLEIRDLYVAKHAISGYPRRTPLVRSEQLSALTGGDIHLKWENLQDQALLRCVALPIVYCK